MEIKFRRLTPNEIEARIEVVSEIGARVLFYKTARVDQNFLDTAVGRCNWQNSYRDVAGRLVSVIEIWDEEKKQWIHKEDMGEKTSVSKVKGEASDAFKRCGTVWGIGRELYGLPKIIIPKDRLISYKEEGNYYECHDEIKVEEITYDDSENIISIKLSNHFNGKSCFTTFGKNVTETVNDNSASSVSEDVKPCESEIINDVENTENLEYLELRDSEIILFGDLKGKRYGEVKSSEKFKGLLKWSLGVKTPNMSGEKLEQFIKLKELASVSEL